MVELSGNLNRHSFFLEKSAFFLVDCVLIFGLSNETNVSFAFQQAEKSRNKPKIKRIPVASLSFFGYFATI
jgi:hypothetical protein